DDGRWLYAGTLGGSVHRIMLKAGGPPAPPPGPPGPPGVPRPPVPPHGGGAAATLWSPDRARCPDRRRRGAPDRKRSGAPRPPLVAWRPRPTTERVSG